MDESVVKEFEQQQVGKLKLSQAIRIGAKRFPTPSIVWHGRDGGACLFGCIGYAMNGQEDDIVWGIDIAEYFGIPYAEVHAMHQEYLESLVGGRYADPRLRMADIAESVGL